MDLNTFLYIAGGTAAMIVVMLFCRKMYALSLVKGILSMLILTVIGVIGVKLMFFFERELFLGLSFYGAVFFIRCSHIYILATKDEYLDYLDFSAPSVAASWRL